MNEKVCKKMRRHARFWMAKYNLDPGIFKQIYKAMKKRYKCEVRMAKFNITSNKFIQRTKTAMEEGNDPHNK